MDKPKIRRDKELNDMVKEMRRIGIRQFREYFGQETVDQINEMAKSEKRLFPIKEKIRLQGILKHAQPMCEKCVFWHGVQKGDKPCEFDKLEKNITFDSNELFHESVEIEVCEKFAWVKDDK